MSVLKPRFTMSRIRGLQYLLLLASEAAWTYPWTIAVGAWLGGFREPLLPLPAVVALLFLALASAILFAAGRASRAPARLLPVVLGIAAVLLTTLANLPGPVSLEGFADPLGLMFGTPEGVRAACAGFAAGVIWWRGLSLGAAPPGLEVVEGEFRTSVVAMTSLLLMGALAGKASPLAGLSLVPSALVLVFVNLVGMPLARVAGVRGRSRHQGAPEPGSGGPWAMMLVSVVAAILLTTLLLAQLFTYDRIAAIWVPLQAGLDAILRPLIYLLALPFALLVQGIVFILRALLPPGDPRNRPEAESQDWMKQLGDPSRAATLSPEILTFMKALLALAIAAVLVWLLLRAVARLGSRIDLEGAEESRDFVWSWPGLGGLKRWVRGRLAFLERRPAHREAVAGGAATSITIRRLYREFQRLGARIGRTRHPAETPLEYQARLLAESRLEGMADVGTITEGYVEARYGAGEVAREDVAEVASAVARLEALWDGKDGNRG